MPFNRAAYPADWPAISRRIRFERAQGRCEECGVTHGARGARDCHGVWHDELAIHNMNSSVGEALWPAGFPRIITIVLTCAHLPGADTMDCRDEVLRSLCQACHLRLDAPLHAGNARRTRRRRRNAGMGLLPFDEDLAGHLAVVGVGTGGRGR